MGTWYCFDFSLGSRVVALLDLSKNPGSMKVIRMYASDAYVWYCISNPLALYCPFLHYDVIFLMTFF
jgi:hypothetical protein